MLLVQSLSVHEGRWPSRPEVSIAERPGILINDTSSLPEHTVGHAQSIKDIVAIIGLAAVVNGPCFNSVEQAFQCITISIKNVEQPGKRCVLDTYEHERNTKQKPLEQCCGSWVNIEYDTKLHITLRKTNSRKRRQSLDRFYKLQNTKHPSFLVVALDIIHNDVSGVRHMYKRRSSIVASLVERRPLCEKAHCVGVLHKPIDRCRI